MTSSDERISQILREYETVRAEEKAAQKERIEEVYAALPRVRAIDSEIQNTAINAINYYRTSGERDKKKLISYLKENNDRLVEEKRKLMEDAGFDEDYMDIHYRCSLCQDTGYVDGKKCRCMTQKLIRLSYASSNMEDILKAQNFSTFDIDLFSEVPVMNQGTSARDRISSIREGLLSYVKLFPNVNPKNIYLEGQPGTGKTFLTSCIAKEIMDRGFSVLYMNSDDLCQELLNERFAKADTISKADLIRNADLLIIDDLGTEYANQLSQTVMLNLINKRLFDNKAMIISSNIHVDDLSKYYSERLRSRIYGSFRILTLLGEDLRIKKAKK